MPVKFHLIRPDDLLDLLIEGENLRLDASQPEDPALVAEDLQLPAYLIVNFPPQTIAEQAFYESSPSTPPPGEENQPYNQPPPPGPNVSVPVQARIGRGSRLVFSFPAGSNPRIPFTTASLLDWEDLSLNVSPIAGLPPEPSSAERQSAPAISEPARLETAIELPYRLLLSPNGTAAWRNASLPKTHAGFTELWHTRLVQRPGDGEFEELSPANLSPLRAIWSPDFNPAKFLASDPPEFGKPDLDWGVLTAMTPFDRHEIVILTSGFHGYVRDKDDFRDYIPRPVWAEQLMLSSLGGYLRSRGEWDPPAPFRPFFISPFPRHRDWDVFVREFKQIRPRRGRGRGLADLPVNLEAGRVLQPDSDENAAGNVPPGGQAMANIPPILPIGAGDLVSVLWPPVLGETGDLLSVSEWRHIATQGRDHYVRIVYEGHLYPFGHRAALIKVTERKIRDVKLANGSSTPLAYMVQRMFIVVRQPMRDYSSPEIKPHLEFEGRALPFKTIRLTTLVTPDIARPEDGSQVPGTTYSFWVRLGQGTQASDDFKFGVVAEDYYGERVNFNASLIFVPFGEGSRQLVPPFYNASGDERACPVPGEKVTYAPPAGPNSQNTLITTDTLFFSTHTAPVNKTFGGFLPRLFKAQVSLPAIQAILGSNGGTQIAYSSKYLTPTPDNTTGLFAEVVKEVSSGVLSAAKMLNEFSADKAGGFATPNLSVSGLTSSLGPLAGDLAKAANDVFDPADFFGDVADASKLFGTFKLTDLLEPLTMTAGAPKVKFDQQPIAVPPPSLKTKLIAQMDWTPEVHELNFGIATFHPKLGDTPAKLEVHGRMEKIIELPPPPNPDPGTAAMDGFLTNFTIELLHVVEILFKRFAFSAGTGKKLDVTVELDPGTPVRFIDDLQFVEELRKSIPAGLFGDGPSLDISPVGIKAGFSLGLPPVGVGVFSLRDVVLSAFVELPFLEGMPTFDFGFSSREHPFNLTVMIFGGGGFFHLQVDTKGVKMLEAALEFGASASIDLGVASGGVHIMAGIYFSIERREIDGVEVDAATLAGYLRLGGELSVLGLISVSLEFYLEFRYEFAKNAAYGTATLTVKVEVLFFSTSVEITVEKRFGGSSGDPLFNQGFETPAIWEEYAGAFA